MAKVKRIAIKRASVFAIVDALHDAGFSHILIEDFQMDDTWWSRIYLTDSDISTDRMEIIQSICDLYDAKMFLNDSRLAAQASRLGIWPTTEKFDT